MTSILEVEQLDTLSSNASSTLTIGGTNTTTIAFGPNVTTTPSSLANTPMFFGKKVSDQSISDNTSTKLTGFTTGEMDSDNAFDGTKFTVPSGKAGKYYIGCELFVNFSGVGNDGYIIQNMIYVNGSQYNEMKHENTNNATVQFKYYPSYNYTILNLSASDYVEMYIYLRDTNGGGGVILSTYSTFFGYKLIGA
jgi:hypothetical protein